MASPYRIPAPPLPPAPTPEQPSLLDALARVVFVGTLLVGGAVVLLWIFGFACLVAMGHDC